jgi:dihydrofolate reductase
MNNNKVIRKLRLQVQMSIDGCIAGPNNEMDWLVWDNNYIKYINEITESVDTIIMGRKMVDGFIPYWTEVMNKPNDQDDPWNAIAKKMVEIPKVVFTKTLHKSE